MDAALLTCPTYMLPGRGEYLTFVVTYRSMWVWVCGRQPQTMVMCTTQRLWPLYTVQPQAHPIGCMCVIPSGRWYNMYWSNVQGSVSGCLFKCVLTEFPLACVACSTCYLIWANPNKSSLLFAEMCGRERECRLTAWSCVPVKYG